MQGPFPKFAVNNSNSALFMLTLLLNGAEKAGICNDRLHGFFFAR
jgi:hypothetical protein